MAADSSSIAGGGKPLFSLFNTKRSAPAAPQPAPGQDATALAPQPAPVASSSQMASSSSKQGSSAGSAAARTAPSGKTAAVKGAAGTNKGQASSAAVVGASKAAATVIQAATSSDTTQTSSSPAQGSTSNGRVSSLPTSRSRTRSHDSDDDEDDLVILSSKPSTSARRPASKKSKTASLASTRSSTPVITIPDSPPAKPRGSTSSFVPLSQLHRASREKRKANEPVEARWPTEEEHGSVQRGRSYAPPAGRWQSSSSLEKGKGKAVEQDGQKSVFEQWVTSLASAEPSQLSSNHPHLHHEPLASINNLLPTFPSHPLLDRIADPFRATPPLRADFARPHDQNASLTPSASELWTVKYTPKAAAEVLGSTSNQSARLLKDWLSELAILGSTDAIGEQQKRRRTINRGAKHPRKKKKRAGSDLDDFIASEDEDDDGSEASAAETDSDDGNGPSFRPAGSTFGNRSVFRSLTNLILLVGPQGSGKTSTVHAVASEMDWSVFEVYPGIGKRGAKDVERYVGDVGKNHMVRGGGGPGSPKKSTVGAASMFAMFRKPQVGEEAAPAPAALATAATQSVILFDEVDVLYREEKDFWSGLISLAKQSRRPIVLTCTDISQVPLEDLGLQRVEQGDDISLPYLSFDAPEPSLAVPFLSLVALREGHILTPSHISALYDSTMQAARPSWLIRGPADPLPHPFPATPEPARDLRRALAQLQFECQWGVGDSTGGVGWMDFSAQREEQTLWSVDTLIKPDSKTRSKLSSGDPSRSGTTAGSSLAALQTIADSLSFADAFVDRRNEVILEDQEPRLSTSAADEEISDIVLDFPPANDRQLPNFGREVEMADTLLSRAPRAQRDLPELIRSKQFAAVIDAGIMVAVRGLIESPAPLLPNPAIFVDYLPFLRLMTEAEDALASLEDDGSDSAGARRGRRSTRSTKAGYQRQLDWTPEEARLVREWGFDLH